jgi:hypothetical protein
MIAFSPRGVVILRPLSTLFVGEKIDKTKALTPMFSTNI